MSGAAEAGITITVGFTFPLSLTAAAGRLSGFLGDMRLLGVEVAVIGPTPDELDARLDAIEADLVRVVGRVPAEAAERIADARGLNRLLRRAR